MEKKNRINLKGIVRYVYKRMGDALIDYDMINHNDRILIGVSGGKASVSLLELFLMRKKRLPFKFEIVACFIRTSCISVDSDRLINFFRTREIEYIVKEVKDGSCDRLFWCDRKRRKVIFDLAQNNNCNKIALGYTLDDTVENILIDLFLKGEVNFFLPNIYIKELKMNVIRPLCYIDRKDMEVFYHKMGLPDFNYKGSYRLDESHIIVKEMINNVEDKCSFVKKNLIRALKRVKKDYLF